jgi:hypothetical protein
MKEGPSGSAIRSLIPSHRELLRSKAGVVSVAEKSGTMIPAGMVERGERKRTAAEASKAEWAMSKPGGDHSSGISSGDALIPPERHPACRRREARPGSGMERENLAGDAKGKGASGSNREAESTDAPERGGLPRSSEEGSVMELERRGRVIAVDVGQSVCREEPIGNGRRQPFAR